MGVLLFNHSEAKVSGSYLGFSYSYQPITQKIKISNSSSTLETGHLEESFNIPFMYVFNINNFIIAPELFLSSNFTSAAKLNILGTTYAMSSEIGLWIWTGAKLNLGYSFGDVATLLNAGFSMTGLSLSAKSTKKKDTNASRGSNRLLGLQFWPT
ncbi:MAG: hypothetical protein LBI29_00015 [Rickettsiales bacterium]|jgi:hypothetical protein|nr:hypothetical protein [Rickettsiales bacterium]